MIINDLQIGLQGQETTKYGDVINDIATGYMAAYHVLPMWPWFAYPEVNGASTWSVTSPLLDVVWRTAVIVVVVVDL